MDGVLVANECIHSRHRVKLPGILCKLYFEKAYNMVDWAFFTYVLQRMGFGRKWRSWIHEYVSLASFFVLVNESPKGFFKAQWGLRQGDPLSPSLFVLIGEDLCRMIYRAMEAHLISGFRPTVEGPTITHLQFADDIIIFCNANEEEVVRNVKAIILCFSA